MVIWNCIGICLASSIDIIHVVVSLQASCHLMRSLNLPRSVRFRYSRCRTQATTRPLDVPAEPAQSRPHTSHKAHHCPVMPRRRLVPGCNDEGRSLDRGILFGITLDRRRCTSQLTISNLARFELRDDMLSSRFIQSCFDLRI
jgi:hypothetical protein